MKNLIYLTSLGINTVISVNEYGYKIHFRKGDFNYIKTFLVENVCDSKDFLAIENSICEDAIRMFDAYKKTNYIYC